MLHRNSLVLYIVIVFFSQKEKKTPSWLEQKDDKSSKKTNKTETWKSKKKKKTQETGKEKHGDQVVPQ